MGARVALIVSEEKYGAPSFSAVTMVLFARP